MPPTKITKVINIVGMPCKIGGNTEEELQVDEDLARELVYRCKGSFFTVGQQADTFTDIINLAKALQSTIPSIVFLKTHHYSDEDILKVKEE